MIDLLHHAPENLIGQIIRNIVASEADYKRHFSQAIIAHYRAIAYGSTWNLVHRNHDGQDYFYKINHFTTHQKPIDVLSKLRDISNIPKEFIYTNNYQVIQLITHFNKCPDRSAYYLSSNYDYWKKREKHFQMYHQTPNIRSFQRSVKLGNEVEVTLSTFSLQ